MEILTKVMRFQTKFRPLLSRSWYEKWTISFKTVLKLDNYLPPNMSRFVAKLSLSVYNTNKSNAVQTDSGTNSKNSLAFSRDGDEGFSSIDGIKVAKDSHILEAAGTTEELSCFLGLAREYALDNKHPYSDKITRIQTMLVDISADIMKIPKLGDVQEADNEEKSLITSCNTKELEEWIEEYSKHLPPLENHILPDGGKSCTTLHIARVVCRRAERSVTPLVREKQLGKEVLIYFNRLADFLLTVSRYAAQVEGKEENIYTPADAPKEKDKEKAEQT